MLYYLASIVLTALIEFGIILIVDGNKYSKINSILSDKKQTIGLVLILVGFGLVPVVNLIVVLVLIMLWGFGEL